MLSLAMPFFAFADEVTGNLGAGLSSGLTGGVPTAPVASQANGYSSTSSFTVTLTASSANLIRYTINGDTPSCPSTGTFYEGAITISSSRTLKAIACYDTGSVVPSAVATYNYTITAPSYGGGGGGGAADVTAPVITSIVATPTGATTATVAWQTGESSLSWVVYGLNTAYGSQVKTSAYATSHSVTLTGLTASTLYHFQVKSQDSSGNIGISADGTFTTLAQGEGTTTTTTTTTGTTGTTTGTSFSSMTREQLLAYIIQLIASLQGGQTGTTGGTTGTGTGTGTGTTGGTTGQTGGTTATGLSGIPATFSFQTNLRFGMNSEDVRYLQIILNSDPDTRVAAAGVGSSGRETVYFGNATLAAVKTFQVKYAIAGSGNSGYGLVGPATRAKLNSLLGK